MESSIKLHFPPLPPLFRFTYPLQRQQRGKIFLCSSSSFLSLLSSFHSYSHFLRRPTRKSLHSKDDIPDARFRFFRHKSYGKKQIIDIAAAINSRSRVIAATTESCEDRSVTMPMEFTRKKNYREHRLAQG